MHTTTYRTPLPAPRAEAFSWHERPGAFERLTPPWQDVRVVSAEGGIRDGARVVLKVRKGPVDFTWELRHLDYVAGERFVDEQVQGPFAHYRHEHRFLPGPDPDSCVLEDALTWDVPLGSAGDLLGGGMVERDLERVFRFRHERLAADLALHRSYRERPRLRVAVTGAGGLMGSALRALLTTGGHTVVPMVRDRERARSSDAVFWDPEAGVVDEGALQRVDALVHLAGEPINAMRWTAEKKRAIRESRVHGTELLARTVAGLPDGPRTLVMASAVGFYGGRGDERLDEQSGPGKGFLADTVQAWEAAARRAEGAGIRVAKVRFGLVLSTAGGALPKMLWAFRSGVAGRIGSGRQYVPWIDLDDAVGILFHALMEPGTRGVLNGTGPEPVTNAAFTDVLGRILRRPTLIPVPSLAVKGALGEMGEELLLRGQRARPVRTLASGYRFRFESLEASLRHQLGREG
ncbi:MAG: TIGR01777 family oxidoreductase [Longimicrobiales bacterium]|nr:TIGR01777 family oxidoreductase [Longimicrobiales bacterium]